MFKHQKLFCLLLTAVLVACPPVLATTFNSNGAANFYEVQSSKNLTSLGVKAYQQTEDYTCAPAVAMSFLHYYHRLPKQQLNKVTEMRIAKEMGTSKAVGTSPKQLARWLEEQGFTVKIGENGSIAMLRENLRKGIPTLVEWIDWGGHWVIVTGYYQVEDKPNGTKDTIFLADPASQFSHVQNPDGILSINVDKFSSMWFDAQYFKPGHIVKGIYMTAIPKK